jgi:tetratricopeptide (TPR) repeat protein
MIRLAALLLALASPTLADTARVVSGEHADFTRLVVELPQDAVWTVGRIPLGYAFATDSAAQPGYDLSRVWNRIPRTRLRALRANPETGALELTLACPCHVFPFEYRPGMIVLDIKDGPPPLGSSFEAPFTGLSSRAAPEPKIPTDPPLVYDWLDRPDRPGPSSVPEEIPLPLATGTRSLGPLRDELLEQISRGASQGVVDMVLPGRAPDVPANDVKDLPWSHIRIGEMPGVVIGSTGLAGGVSADGTACLADAVVDLPSWGGDRPALDLLSEARLNLFGEFDRVDPDAVMQSIRLHLYLGFGVEALQIAELLVGSEAPEDLRVYQSMARLMDGQSDPETPFGGMLGCEGAVALWAALARDRLPPGPEVNVDAIVRSFVGLPPHLRQNLGPDLSEKLLLRGDADAARIIRDAIQRSPDSSEAEVALLDAKADLQADRNDAARDHAERSIETGANTVEGLLALVEGHFRDAEPLSPDVAAALLAFQREAATEDEAKAVQRAQILALALSDQTSAAFTRAEDFKSVLPDLWQVAQQRANDDDFLRQAVLTPDEDPPPVKPEVALAIATRLVDLGFADPALAWLGPVTASDPDQRRRVAAQAEMLRGDARVALALLGTLSDPVDAGLRAKALVQLGRLQSAREAYEAAGLPEEAARLIPWLADWPQVQNAGAAPWSVAAAVATGPSPVEAGPLARGTALVEESATARAALEALLSSVEGPSP